MQNTPLSIENKQGTMAQKMRHLILTT